MSLSIGPMLGRLTTLKDPLSGQEFPDNWRWELKQLKTVGADCLEWLVVDVENNPLYHINLSHYPIASINIHSLVLKELSFDELDKICFYSRKQGIFKLVLPMMGASAIKDKSWTHVYHKLSQKYPELSFSFETELNASEIIEFINTSDSFFVTYDTGNATACNFDHSKEIETLKSKIDNVHLKDRISCAGASVEPFSGDTDFNLIFDSLSMIGYTGKLILETFRGPAGKEVETVSGYIERFKCLT